jgi:hypothetical protein
MTSLPEQLASLVASKDDFNQGIVPSAAAIAGRFGPMPSSPEKTAVFAAYEGVAKAMNAWGTTLATAIRAVAVQVPGPIDQPPMEITKAGSVDLKGYRGKVIIKNTGPTMAVELVGDGAATNLATVWVETEGDVDLKLTGIQVAFSGSLVQIRK